MFSTASNFHIDTEVKLQTGLPPNTCNAMKITGDFLRELNLYIKSRRSPDSYYFMWENATMLWFYPYHKTYD